MSKKHGDKRCSYDSIVLSKYKGVEYVVTESGMLGEYFVMFLSCNKAS